MLIIYKRSDESQGVSYNVTETNTDVSITISANGLYGRYVSPQTITLNKEKLNRKIITVAGKKGTYAAELIYSINYDKLETSSIEPESNNCIFELARVFIDGDTVSIVFYYPNADILNAENVELPPSIIVPEQALFQYNDNARSIRDAWLLKQEIIGNIVDTSKSITYLESQIDILYKCVQKLMIAANIDNTDFNDIFAAVNENSVLAIKGTDKILDEIRTDKARIREIQKEYYNKKP